jgi:ADP-ribose pyrophosphatase YjhB (NUDIX family)
MKPFKLPMDEFLATFKNVPRIAIDLIVTNSIGQILLTRRNIPPFPGTWHFPGSFLLKDEPILAAQQRIAQDELGLKLDTNSTPSLLGVFEDLDSDPRGHVVDVVYGIKINDPSLIKPTKETKEIKFFDKNQLPSDIGFNHRDTLSKLGYTCEEF